MSDAKHTPGPWVTGNDGQDFILEDSEDGGRICNVCFGSEEWTSLISAAPDLLAACVSLVAVCGPIVQVILNAELDRSFGDPLSPGNRAAQGAMRALNAALIEAQAAIAKAKGGAP